jgi:D-3-phosphoglycerate dehydrogenase
MDNVIVTPHTAFFSQQSLQELRRRAAQSVAAVLKGQMPEHVFNGAVLPHARAKVKAG